MSILSQLKNVPMWAWAAGAFVFVKMRSAVAEEVPASASQLPALSSGGVSFGAAFASARAAGLKTFNWNGSSYTTKLASEK